MHISDSASLTPPYYHLLHQTSFLFTLAPFAVGAPESMLTSAVPLFARAPTGQCHAVRFSSESASEQKHSSAKYQNTPITTAAAWQRAISSDSHSPGAAVVRSQLQTPPSRDAASHAACCRAAPRPPSAALHASLRFDLGRSHLFGGHTLIDLTDLEPCDRLEQTAAVLAAWEGRVLEHLQGGTVASAFESGTRAPAARLTVWRSGLRCAFAKPASRAAHDTTQSLQCCRATEPARPALQTYYFSLHRGCAPAA